MEFDSKKTIAANEKNAVLLPGTKRGWLQNRMIATGVRWAESIKRKERSHFEVFGKTKASAIRVTEEKMLLTDNENTRKLFEKCEMKARTIVNPIIDWPDTDIWEFYRHECKRHNHFFGGWRTGTWTDSTAWILTERILQDLRKKEFRERSRPPAGEAIAGPQ